MKRFSKIFVSVVAMAAIVGCATDATEDLGVKVGGTTQLTLSLDGSRTQLGEKADGVYPLTWSLYDQISVNGVASDPLATEDGAGTARATFTFGGALTTPYFVAYPATAEGQVLFAAEQNYTSNTTFDSNAAVMYGYSANGENIKLKHLTGVLKIGIEGSAKITTVRISTIDRKPIAGAFEAKYDTEKQDVALTPVEGATSSVITYNFLDEYGDKGSIDLSMQNETTYIHVAVPAGEYNELYVTIEDEMGGVMYKTVKTDNEAPLNAGKVREFASTITYAPMDGVDTFVISDFFSLVTLKEELEAAQKLVDDTTVDDADEQKVAAVATLSRNAVVVNDIEINPAQVENAGGWSPIEATSYTGTINGNGYEIKGLPAPLFNNTAASFRGLHMNVIVEETKDPNFGAFARQLAANGNAPTVEHCSASGAVTIKTNVTPSTEDSIPVGATGGLVGVARGVKFYNCVNNISFTVNQLSTTKKVIASVAGIAGFADVGNGVFSLFSNCSNHGDITCNDSTGMCIARLGGIASIYYGAGGDITFDNCNNSGDLSTSNGAVLRQICIGGIISQPRCTEAATIAFANNTTNSGTIYVKGTGTDHIRVGGVIGHSRGTITYNFNGPVTNSGAITVDASAQTYVAMGGVIGQIDDVCNVHFYNTTTNTKSANLSLYGTIKKNARCGGIIGIYSAEAKQFFYFHTKTHTNNGDITFDGKCEGKIYLGGIVGITESVSINSIDNARVINNGNVSIKEGAVITGYTHIAGVVSSMSNYAFAGSDGQCANTGTISFKGEAKSNFYMGGLIANTASGMTLAASYINTGDIVATGKIDTSKTTRVAGAVGGFSAKKAFCNTQCFCNITAYFIDDNGTVTSYPRVAMFTGRDTMTEDSFKNNFIGGKIATTATVANGVVTPIWKELTETNCYGYVIALNEDKTSFTGVSYLSSKDAIDWGNYGE